MIRKGFIVVLMLCTFLVLLVGWVSKNDMSMLAPNRRFDFANWTLNIVWYTSPSTGVSGEWSFCGFAYYFWATDGVTVIHIPLWIVAGLFATYPTIAFIRGPLRRYRCRRKGLCIHCGYNLLGNTSGTCPECGTEIQT